MPDDKASDRASNGRGGRRGFAASQRVTARLDATATQVTRSNTWQLKKQRLAQDVSGA